MMKQVKIKLPLRMLTLAGGMLLTASSWAQTGAIKGQVKDATGEPVMGATITANGKAVGITDMDGNYSVNVPAGTKLTITYLGMSPQTVTAADGAVTTLSDDSKALNEVVVIGYGAVKKSDLTGSVTALKPDSKNHGLIVNAQDMIQGKIAGVNVTSSSGAPGAGATIRIRGGASLNASNDPLIVIDGVPMDNNGLGGLSNPLSMVNPQDIESFNVLKDASATAIYGSRGSNGVIIITTKKGHKGQKLSVSYNGSVTMSMKRKTMDVLNGNDFRSFIQNLYAGTSSEADVNNALGNSNTDWQDEIYRTAWSQDHGVTLSGAATSWMPFRVSLGYTGDQGILKTSKFDRYTANVALNPSFFDNHLKVTFNIKGMYAKTRYADTDAIGAAVRMDPTQPVYADGSYYMEHFPNLFKSQADADAYAQHMGGYFEWPQDGKSLNDPTWALTHQNLATHNPVALLNSKYDRALSRDLMTNIDIDYQVNGFEDLRFHATAGLDLGRGRQETHWDPFSPSGVDQTYYGRDGWDNKSKRNWTFSGYSQYYHDFNDKYKNHFDIMLGSEYQSFWRNEHNRYWGFYPETNTVNAGNLYKDTYYNFATENRLLSFFGRSNWSLMDGRYMVTATVRADGSSRFNWLDPWDNKQWGVFPSAAFAWRINEEKAFRDLKWLSDLKLRLSYGVTGQQEIGQGDYPYYETYTMNSGTNNYYFKDADGNYIPMARPNATNHDLTWEKTHTYNIGFDYGFWNQRLSGTIDFYVRKTTDLINQVFVDAGSTFKNSLVSNIGDMKNTGLEISIHGNPIQTKDWNWMLDYNFTWNRSRITKLTGGNDDSYYVATGSISGGTGNTIQAHKVGYAPSSFYVYQQVYDANGRPIAGQVVDRNGDGQITDADKYLYKSPMAPVTMGLSSRLEYKNWDFGFTLRASLGNYVYNNFESNMENVGTAALWRNGFLENRTAEAVRVNWQSDNLELLLSDRYVHNASFLKCDNITLGYTFNNLLKCAGWHGISGRIYGAVNNVFTITDYKGIDPEVFGGIDNNMYPRPFSATLGVNLNF